MTIEVDGKTLETDEEGYLVNLSDWSEDVANAIAQAENVEMSFIPEVKNLLSYSGGDISSFPELTGKIYAMYAGRFGRVIGGEHTTTLPVVERG